MRVAGGRRLTVRSRLSDGGDLKLGTSRDCAALFPTRHMKHLVRHAAVAVALAGGTACRDAIAPEPVRTTAPPVPPSNPSTPQTPPPPPTDAIWFRFGGPGIVEVAGDTIVLSAPVLRGTAELPDSLTFETSDTSIVAIDVVERNVVQLRALKSGTANILARTSNRTPELSTRATLQVFARSNRPSPIVVDEFSLLKSATTLGPFYEPRLRLRDTSATGTAKVIGLAIDLPEVGWSVICSPDRLVGGAGWSAFNPPGDMDYGLFLAPRSSGRVGPPTVRVIALLSDGLAVSSKVTGGALVIANDWQWHDGDDTGARCQ